MHDQLLFLLMRKRPARAVSPLEIEQRFYDEAGSDALHSLGRLWKRLARRL